MDIDKHFILYCFLVILSGIAAIAFIVCMAILISGSYYGV